MRKKILAAVALVVIFVMVLAGCSDMPFHASYKIPMIDLDEGVIRYMTKDDAKKGFSEKIYQLPENEVLKNDKYSFMFDKTIVADESNNNARYLAHPDSISLKRQKKGSKAGKLEFTDEVLTVYTIGHGRGPLQAIVSYDGGVTYEIDSKVTNTPKSWTKSQETGTLYRLTFNKDNVSDDNDLIMLVSGNPSWHDDNSFKRNGFNVSLSAPSMDANGDKVEGRVWSEFETWYGNGTSPSGDKKYVRNPVGAIKAYDAIVAMSSLTRLKTEKKENGKVVVGKDGKPVMEWSNSWMGLFHDHMFNCYKTILTFRPQNDEDKLKGYPTYTIQGQENMVMEWSEPTPYYEAYRGMQVKSGMCEVECIRSDAGQGDTLALITRSNTTRMNSVVITSTDEGKTWSAPREVQAALSGERHKAEWVKVDKRDDKGKVVMDANGKIEQVDKLFITFRSRERSTSKIAKYAAGSSTMSEGWVAWVGDWDDLITGKSEGDFRVKLAHTYNNGQKDPSRNANSDTGYCGNAVLPNGRVATCSYGRFSSDSDPIRGANSKDDKGATYILGKVVDVNGLYQFFDIKAELEEAAKKPNKK